MESSLSLFFENFLLSQKYLRNILSNYILFRPIYDDLLKKIQILSSAKKKKHFVHAVLILPMHIHCIRAWILTNSSHSSHILTVLSRAAAKSWRDTTTGRPYVTHTFGGNGAEWSTLTYHGVLSTHLWRVHHRYLKQECPHKKCRDYNII